MPTPPACICLAPPQGAFDLLRGLDEWRARAGGPARWRLEGGVLTTVPGTGDLVSVRQLEDFQLHVELRIPNMVGVHGQGRGNGGIYLHGRYEIQLLDSFGDPPADDACGALYKVAPPARNASLPAEEWQSFEVAFRAPRGSAPAIVSVLHNGLLVHDAVALAAPTPGALDETRPVAGPLLLQDHGAPIAFRNLWVLPV